MKDPDHALRGEFQRLPQGCRFRSLVCKTSRGGNSFVPTAIDDLRKSRGLHSVRAYGHGAVYIGPCLRVYRRVGTLLLGVQ